MRTVIAPAFAAPDDWESLSEEPLVVHRRAQPAGNDKLVLFVHGLGGKRYGKGATWGRFPELMFEDLPEADVGLYQYRTLTGRLGSAKSVSLEVEARVFADLLRDELAEYGIIVLIGHSMGGLLCKAVIHELVTRPDRDTLARVGGLVLMATPQLGSLRVPSFMKAFSHDFRALAPHSNFVEAINNTFQNQLALDESTLTLRKTTIPTWAVEGAHDWWVDSLSAGIGLPWSRRKVVRGSHTSIVKPADRNADAYNWVKSKVSIAMNRFKYDVFLGAAMAAHKDEPQYAEDRAAVLELIQVLKDACGFKSVFYAGEGLATKEAFDPKALALTEDLLALRSSRYFIMYYPKRLPSSVLYEAGWALVLGKPSIYVIRGDQSPDEGLPFLLNDASQAFKERRVRIFKCPNTPSMLQAFSRYGPKLFRYTEDAKD